VGKVHQTAGERRLHESTNWSNGYLCELSMIQYAKFM
jgi:hypothetical protein